MTEYEKQRVRDTVLALSEEERAIAVEVLLGMQKESLTTDGTTPDNVLRDKQAKRQPMQPRPAQAGSA